MMIILFAMFALTDLNTDIISQFSSKYIREPHHFLISIQYSGDGQICYKCKDERTETR
jgi:hypothetical protein